MTTNATGEMSLEYSSRQYSESAIHNHLEIKCKNRNNVKVLKDLKRVKEDVFRLKYIPLFQ